MSKKLKVIFCPFKILYFGLPCIGGGEARFSMRLHPCMDEFVQLFSVFGNGIFRLRELCLKITLVVGPMHISVEREGVD